MSNSVRVYWSNCCTVTVERTVIYFNNSIVAGESPNTNIQEFDLPPVDDDDDMPNLNDNPIDDRSPNHTPLTKEDKQEPTTSISNNHTD